MNQLSLLACPATLQLLHNPSRARSWLSVLAIILAVLLAGALLRRLLTPDHERLMKQRMTQDAGNAYRRWVQAAFFVITRDADYAYLSVAEGRRMLAEWWDIHGPIEYRRTLDRLREPDQADNAWDLLRFIVVSRLGVAANFVTNDESWAAIRPVARRLQQAYPGWNAMAQAYLRARRQWRGLALDGSEDDAMMQWVVANVQQLRQDLWTEIDFETDYDA